MVACTILSSWEKTNVTDKSLKELVDQFPLYTVIERRWTEKRFLRKDIEHVSYHVYYHYNESIREDVQALSVPCNYDSVHSYFWGMSNALDDIKKGKIKC